MSLRRILILLLTLPFASACSLFSRGAEEPLGLGPVFTVFPPKFTALQSLQVDWKGERRTVVASLRRERGEYRVTFLHPAFQTPLLELRNFGPEESRARYFVEKERLPFQPKMVLDAIVALYNAPKLPPDPEDPSGKSLTTDGVVYRLRDAKSFAGCVFPETIELRFRAGDSPGSEQVLPLILIETKELECR